MRGIDLERVRDVLVSTFNPDEFDMLLRFKFDIDRQDEVGDGPFKRVVFQVLTKAEQEGWDPLLIAEAAAARPMRKDVQSLYVEYAQGLVDAARQEAIRGSLEQAQARFGLTPSLRHQEGGVAGESIPATTAGLERVVRPLLPFLDAALWRERLFRLECRVCRVETGVSGPGTGFLIGPDAVMTNYHVLKKVLETPAGAGGVRLRFDYRVLANGLKSEGVAVGLHPTDWLVAYGPYTAAEGRDEPDAEAPRPDELDFAVVRLSRRFGDEPVKAQGADALARGWVRLPTAAPALVPLAALLILQHPQGGPLKLAFDTAPDVRLVHGGRRVRYATNTDGGSSGSPVFDLDWNLVALHHYGDPAVGQPKFNQGVPIGLIRDRLKDLGQEGVLGGDPP